MSYDVRFGVKVEGMNGYIAVLDAPDYSSPTYNLREMFVACMEWDYSQGEWYNCIDVLPKFQRGLHELRFNREQYKQYNPPNGWGSIDSAIGFMESVVQKIGEIVSGDWTWNKIPLEHLWMRW
jgi:hypothetical protein